MQTQNIEKRVAALRLYKVYNISLSCGHVFFILMSFFSTNETEYEDSMEDKPIINGEYLLVLNLI